MEEFVILGPASGKGRILFFLEGVDQRFSILLLAYRRYLHVVRTIAGDSGGVGGCRFFCWFLFRLRWGGGGGLCGRRPLAPAFLLDRIIERALRVLASLGSAACCVFDCWH